MSGSFLPYQNTPPEIINRLRWLNKSLKLIITLFALSLIYISSASAQQFSEFDLLLLDFKLKRDTLGDSVTSYRYNDKVYVSLSESAAALEFPISVDTATQTAMGWFIETSRTFKLDLNNQTVTIEGKVSPLLPDQAILFEDAIYIPIDTYSKWFPIDLSLDIAKLVVNVDPKEPIPFQKRKERQKFAGRRTAIGPPVLPELNLPYQLIGNHFADLRLGYSVQRRTEPEISKPKSSLAYSSLIRGDLAYMTSSIYLGGNNDKQLTAARMTLSREHPYTWGSIQRIEVGDIIPFYVHGAPTVGIEKGLLIKGATRKDRNLYSSDERRTHISGDILEGWEVELIREGVRIDYQVVGIDGRYEFRDIYLHAGENRFELVFYGPSGQQYSETVVRYAGTNTVRPGSLLYQFSASKKGQSLHKTPATTIDVTSPGTNRLSLSAQYGMLKNLAISAGVNSVVENNERLDYYHAGLNTSWKGLSLYVNATRDPLGGTIWNSSFNIPASTRLLGYEVDLQHTRYAKSVLETDSTYQTKLESRTRLSISGVHNTIASRLSIAHDQLIERTATSYAVDISKTATNFRIGNNLNFRTVDDPSTEDTLLGQVYLVGDMAPLKIRTNYFYELDPIHQSRSFQLTAHVPISIDMDMEFGNTIDFITDLKTYNAGLNWKLKYATISPSIRYNSRGYYSGFISAMLSFSPRPDRFGVMINNRPISSRGGIAARVFNDTNSNGLYDSQETPVAGAEISAPHLFRHTTSDQYGSAYIFGVPANRVTDVQLIESTLPDTSMASTYLGNSVKVRPGQWAVIDFPIITTGEIEGILLQEINGRRTPMRGALIEIRDKNDEMVDFKVSGYDGYFLFDNVPYGKYTVTVSDSVRDRLITPPHEVNINKITSFIQGIELVMTADKVVPTGIIPATDNSLEKDGIETPPSIIPAEPVEAPDSFIIPDIQSVTEPAKKTAITPATKSDKNISPFALQLGAFRSEEGAQQAVNVLTQKYNKELKDLNINVVRSDLGNRGIFYRIYASGSLNEVMLRERCNEIKKQNQSCLVVKP